MPSKIVTDAISTESVIGNSLKSLDLEIAKTLEYLTKELQTAREMESPQNIAVLLRSLSIAQNIVHKGGFSLALNKKTELETLLGADHTISSSPPFAVEEAEIVSSSPVLTSEAVSAMIEDFSQSPTTIFEKAYGK
jgi:hypothetical protein